MRQPLAAHFRLGRQKRPAILDQLLVGFRKAIRRLHAGIVMAHASLLVADRVQGEQNFLCKLAAFVENGIDEVRRGLLETRQVRIILDLQQVLQDELHVADWRVVAGHGVLPVK